jgi:hypothetical protein
MRTLPLRNEPRHQDTKTQTNKLHAFVAKKIKDKR